MAFIAEFLERVFKDPKAPQVPRQKPARESIISSSLPPAPPSPEPRKPEPRPTSAPSLVSAVIRAESGGKSDAVSPKGAIGLMQIMPATARDPGFGIDPLSPSELRDPKKNVDFGTKYLNAMLERYNGDKTLALIAYNAGPGVADRVANGELDFEDLPEETQQYVPRVLGFMRQRTSFLLN